MSFGGNVEVHRKKNRLTQEELAKKVDTSKNMISLVERGLRVPNLILADKIARSLDTTIDTLMR